MLAGKHWQMNGSRGVYIYIFLKTVHHSPLRLFSIYLFSSHETQKVQTTFKHARQRAGISVQLRFVSFKWLSTYRQRLLSHCCARNQGLRTRKATSTIVQSMERVPRCDKCFHVRRQRSEIPIMARHKGHT